MRSWLGWREGLWVEDVGKRFLRARTPARSRRRESEPPAVLAWAYAIRFVDSIYEWKEKEGRDSSSTRTEVRLDCSCRNRGHSLLNHVRWPRKTRKTSTPESLLPC